MKRAFTLLELLVTIAIIGVLASLLFAGLGPIKRKSILSRTQAELALVEAACDSYQAKLGFFPPDHPGQPAAAPLWYELGGTYQLDAASYGTTPGESATNGVVTGAAYAITADLATRYLGRSGFANCTPRTHPDGPPQFLSASAPAATAWTEGTNAVRLLTVTSPGPVLTGLAEGVNPLYYVSTHPTNHPAGVDLWARVTIGKQTWLVSNWQAPVQEP